MAYSQFSFPPDAVYSPASGYPHQAASYHHHQYSGFSNASDEIPKPEIYFPTGYPAELLDDADDGDADGKTRLTSEQMNELEREFGLNPKPKTQYKQRVATRLRLNLPRVNNWYQNRRAKAKHQRPTTRDYDGSSNEDTFTSPERGFASLDHEAATASIGTHPSQQTVDFSSSFHGGFEMGSMTAPYAAFDFGLDQFPDSIDGLNQDAFVTDRLHHTGPPRQHAANISPHWSNDDFSASVPHSFVASNPGRQGSTTHSPQSSTGMPAYERGRESVPKKFDAASVSMYHGALFNNNISAHDLTNSSSEAEWSNLLTPPTDTSQLDTPQLPWMANEPHSRRTSESSELATTFANNCQVHQTSVGLGVSDSVISPPTGLQNSAGTSPPISTSNISPIELTAQPTSTVSDIASRRKAQRPEPLVRPMANRSHSYGGPQSISPQLRGPSHSIRPSHSSTVLNGRISKPGSKPGSKSGSAQASPRHFQTQFDIRPPQRETPVRTADDSAVSAAARSNFGSYTQPSPSTSVQSSAAQWQTYSSDDAAGLSPAQLYGNPGAYSSVPDLSAMMTQTRVNITQQQIPHRPRASHQPSDYESPQSAPSHQSTFQLPESPSGQMNVFSAQRWPLAHHNTSDFNLPLQPSMVARPAGHSLHHSFGAATSGVWQPPFAPKVHPGALPGQYNFAAWSQHPTEYAAIPPPPEREFKVEMSVKTKPDQIFVKPTSNDFNFHYATPSTMSADLDKKK